MNRRPLLIAMTGMVMSNALLIPPALAQGVPDLPVLLRKGACALMLRHAQTESGVGDPPGYRLDQCNTQRNLSAEGRQQARQIGQWFTSHRLKPRSVQTSAWCRCKDTAELAFGRHMVIGVLGALNSTFDNRSGQDSQTQALRARLKTIPADQFEVWVTHQVNITALTGEVSAMGEAMLINNKGALLGRALFTS